MAEQAQIITDPNRFGGRPFIAGTDVEVTTIATAHLIFKQSVHKIATDYRLSYHQVYNAVGYFREHSADFPPLVQVDHTQPPLEKAKPLDIFWLTAQNKDFETTRVLKHGEAEKLKEIVRIGIGFSLFVLIVIVVVSTSPKYIYYNIELVPLLLILGGVILYRHTKASVLTENYALLEKAGVLLDGQILDGSLVMVNRSALKVTIRYQFATPDGRTLMEKIGILTPKS